MLYSALARRWRSNHGDQAATSSHGPDARWQQKYNAHLWFQFTPAQLAAWYNKRHAIEELLPPERNGMGLAGWRGERTASIGYTRDGEGWVDFGASARRSDRKQDGGDALELEARISEQSKPETMRQAARDLVKEARASLESAARSGQQPPIWVQELLTPAGRRHYQNVLLQSEAIPAKEALTIRGDPSQARLPIEATSPSASEPGGVVGSCSPDTPSSVPQSLPESLAERGLALIEPCRKCGCPLAWYMEDHHVCVRCYPPRGYHTYSDQVDLLYPRKRRAVFE